MRLRNFARVTHQRHPQGHPQKTSSMKSTLASSARSAAIAAALLVLPAFASAKGREAKDPAGQLLALHGTVQVAAAGPYVEVGTFQIQVAVKLGRPAAKLADGTWLYPNTRVEDSDATGTLLVRFDRGRVSGLSLVTPAVAMALAKAGDPLRIADKK
jgi:hypothetical protein